MARAGAGFTNVSIPFNLSWREAGEPRSRGLLFRGAGKSDPVYPDPKLERQFRVMKCLESTDVPVPRVYWMEKDESLFGFPFYIMEKLEGTVPSEYPNYHSFGICYDASPEMRAKMWWGAIEAMAQLHKLDWKKLGLSFLGAPAAGTGPLDQEFDYYERYLDWTRDEPQPVLEASLAWLRRNRYEPERVSLCWGDARLPNTMFSPQGELFGLLDWDMSVLSDPESDLAFFIALDEVLAGGSGIPRLEGFPDREETVRRYEEWTGWKVRNLFYNEVFALLRSGIVILRVQKNLLKMGIRTQGEDPLLESPCTHRLAALLDLPTSPRSKPAPASQEEASGTVQVRLTGPGGGDWYVVAERGQTTRHSGVSADPDATLSISAEDWAAIQRGELQPFNAWTSGKLKVTGNESLYTKLADAIAKSWS
jgi:aminoglycoside phosphotransferase (APT) family kinase protein/putative sterol carrier protein